MNVFSRFIGIITSPKATFQNVVAHPRWLGMLALACGVAALLVGGYLMTPTGREAWIDAALAGFGGGGKPTEQQIAAMERFAPFAAYLAIAQMFIFLPLFYLIVSGILFAVFNAAMGGTSTFKQLFSVVVHTAPIGVLGQLFTIPLNYLQGTMSSRTNLLVLLPVVDEKSFAGRFLAAIDVFLIWQLLVLAIGLAVLYRRRTQPIAMGLYIAYVLIAVLIAFVMSRFGGTN